MRNTRGSIRTAAVLAAALLSLGPVSACESGESQPLDWAVIVDSTAVVALTAGQTACPDCLHMTHLVTIGDTVGPGYVEATQYVVRDSLGRYWLNQRDRLKVFDSNGTYVAEVGRPGEGPMEFSRPRPIHTDAEGNVHVFDSGNVRETIIGPGFRSVRETRLPEQGLVRSPVPLPQGHRYAVNMWIPTAERIGLPLHVISGEEVLRSFGAGSQDGGPLNPFKAVRIVATDNAGRIFSARRFDYDIEVWTDTGRRIIGFSGPELNAQEVRSTPYDFDDNPIPNEIKDMQTDGAGRLWVLSWRVKPDWQRHLVEQVVPGGAVVLQFKEGSAMDSVYSSRIDVIDLARGTFVARLDQEGLLTAFVGRGLVLENVFLPDGMPRIGIWQVRLEAPDR